MAWKKEEEDEGMKPNIYMVFNLQGAFTFIIYLRMITIFRMMMLSQEIGNKFIYSLNFTNLPSHYRDRSRMGPLSWILS